MSAHTATELVLREVQDGICILTLNRPDRLNAWIPELHQRYFDLLAEAGADPEVRVIVVTGAGRGFCAGADLQALQALNAGEGGEADARGDDRDQTFPTTIGKPIIAAVNGAAAGLGLAMALHCDLRFAAAGAKLTTAFVRRGLIAEHGMAWTLPRLVGPSKALDLLLSGRVVLAEEAERIGLVDRVYAPAELMERTLEYARELATFSSPASMAVMKRQVYESLEQDAQASMEDAVRLMLESFERPDFGEGVASFLEARPPRFAGIGG
jgi:enoyl-CoA hydratase/carnithine racemase